MRKKKGAALPMAVALCSILLIVSMAVGTFLIESFTLNRSNDVNYNNRLYYETYAERFINGDDVSLFPNDRVNWKEYIGETSDIKALVAYRKSDNKMVFYTIYSFAGENPSCLAYQTDSFYIVEKEDGNYIGGIVKLVEE